MEHYKLLRGNRILLDLPEKEESKVILTKEQQEDINREESLKLNRLTVYAVGDLVTDIKAGDVVYMDPGRVRANIIIVTIDGKEKLVASPYDVILIW